MNTTCAYFTFKVLETTVLLAASAADAAQVVTIVVVVAVIVVVKNLFLKIIYDYRTSSNKFIVLSKIEICFTIYKLDM